jgi:hypothetical protein
MFAVSGVIWTKMLLPKKEDKILGIPNRWVVALGGSAFCVFVEYLLNSVGALTWDYSWWNRGAPWLIFVFGYLIFFMVAFWVFDMESLKRKIQVVGGIWIFDMVCLALLIGVFGWI